MFKTYIIRFRYPASKIYIYTGDVESTPKKILDKAQTTFNVVVDIDRINFVYLNLRFFVEAKNYPYFTLLLQSLGSMILGFEALWKIKPGNVYKTYKITHKYIEDV